MKCIVYTKSALLGKCITKYEYYNYITYIQGGFFYK